MRSVAGLLRIAETQFGVVTRRQMLRAGSSDHAIRHLVRTGILRRLYAGVYALAASSRCFEQDVLAAGLACGDVAVASFTSAGALLAICPQPDAVDITVPHEVRRDHAGFRVHRTTVLRDVDVIRRGPLVLTSAIRTLADVARCTDVGDLTSMTDEALRRRLVSPAAGLRYLEHASIRSFPGVGVLKDILGDRMAHGVPESGFEGRMIALLDEYGLPAPVRQYECIVGGRRVRFDLAYPEQRLAIELNGWDPHSARTRWESDHERNNAIEIAAWGRLAFTWRQVNEQRSYVATTVAESLGLRPKGWVASRGSSRPPGRARRAR